MLSKRDQALGRDGADVFTFIETQSGGRDYAEVAIHDFESGTDVIDLSPIADWLSSVAIDGGTAVLTFGSGRTWIALETNAARQASDFAGAEGLAFL
ncbi:M10 family metallopeptidase C-terminal domain-containing protein [Mangrovicoccus sp. HB161399]|uniref:M10 family metallopeptidase C-terminal domain-containing protein n=1 Tax=Mangrovicoccus sp. HB161399 TaxID=2720392 RepID=UPI001555BFF9|nr:hypothetical protein [Mangrovicoccus sp. HB161399]